MTLSARRARLPVNDVEYTQRVAMETRRRPAWLADMDDSPPRTTTSPPSRTLSRWGLQSLGLK